MAELEKYMAIYEGNNMKKVTTLLTSKEKEYILIMYNKFIFYLNDKKCEIWTKLGELSLHKKDNEKSIMVSKFLTEAYRRLKLTVKQVMDYPDILEEA